MNSNQTLTREVIVHRLGGGPKAPVVTEYYEFTEKSGWMRVSTEEGDKWDYSTVQPIEIVHPAGIKARKDGSFGRRRVYLASDNGPDWVAPETEEVTE